MVCGRRLVVLVAFALSAFQCLAEDPIADVASTEVPVSDDSVAEQAGEGGRADVMKQMTIAMASEVVDERSFVVRDPSSKGGRKLIRLGNVAPLAKGVLTDDEYQEKVEAGKASLAKLVDKQMMLWKAAAAEHQPTSEDDDLDGEIVIADAWTVEGRHIPTLLREEGHLAFAPQYESELAKDILTAAADKEKKVAYKKLEEALKESEAVKVADRKAEADARKAEEEEELVEPIGFGGWVGLFTLAVFLVGAVANFGRQDKKKMNLNRKKGLVEKLWMGLKLQ